MPKNGKFTIEKVYKLIYAFRKEMREEYTTKTEFFPVKSIVYGMVALILMGVGTAILATVIRALVVK